jgi:hypothetical protein
MVKTVLTKKKTTNNLFGVNPLFGPNLTILPALKGQTELDEANLHSSENCFLHCSAELELILRLSTKIFNRLLMPLMANGGLS